MRPNICRKICSQVNGVKSQLELELPDGGESERLAWTSNQFIPTSPIAHDKIIYSLYSIWTLEYFVFIHFIWAWICVYASIKKMQIFERRERFGLAWLQCESCCFVPAVESPFRDPNDALSGSSDPPEAHTVYETSPPSPRAAPEWQPLPALLQANQDPAKPCSQDIPLGY